MSKIKNSGLDQYGAEPFEQQQFGPAGVEGVKRMSVHSQGPKTKQFTTCTFCGLFPFLVMIDAVCHITK